MRVDANIRQKQLLLFGRIIIRWRDKKWMQARKKHNALNSPYSVYEVHLGSWKQKVAENRFLSYDELADELSRLCCRNEFHTCRIYANYGVSI